ncbi:MAG: cell division protein FtsW, partial [Actinomycetales bacterium]
MFSDQNSHGEPEDNLLNRPLADYYLVLISAVLLLGLGVMMVLSASSPYAGGNPEIRSPYTFAIRQTIFLAAGGVVGWIISRLQPKVLARFGRLAITFAALLLLAVALLAVFSSSAAIGTRGNTNWLGISKQLAIQPSEFAKLALVLWASATFSERVRKLDQPEKLIIPFVPVSAILIGLVLAGKDLGTAMILGLIVLSLLWFVGTPMRILAGLGAVAGVVAGLLAMTSANRLTRIKVWLDPASDPDIAAQPIASMYALASGGWWGVGLGAGKQKWGGLRNGAHTDFIFSVIGEELGLVGVLVVLTLFAILGFAGLRVALRSDHPLP